MNKFFKICLAVLGIVFGTVEIVSGGKDLFDAIKEEPEEEKKEEPTEESE